MSDTETRAIHYETLRLDVFTAEDFGRGENALRDEDLIADALRAAEEAAQAVVANDPRIRISADY